MSAQQKPFRILSWGCGAPSTTLAVLAIEGHLEPLDAIIHADTQNERRATVEIREWYTDWFRSKGVTVEIVTAGNILELGAKEHMHIPFWTSDGGTLRRQCTREFKITPGRRKARELAGYHPTNPPHPPAGAIEKWLGYTWEETGRQRENDVKFSVNRFPLIEMRWTREHCEAYLRRLGLPIPVKSACVICPYRSAVEYLEMKHLDADEFTQAVEFDEINRHNPLAERAASTADELYIYKSTRLDEPTPLRTADLEADVQHQAKKAQQGWLNFCEGPCGT